MLGLFTLLERYSSLEQTFVSAERIEHCASITLMLLISDINGPPQESTEGDIPEKSWPSKGGIQVEGFSVRYGIDLPDVLHEVSFDVEVSTPCGVWLKIAWTTSWTCWRHWIGQVYFGFESVQGYRGS